ncbi:2-hydroxychromene-2-carboxylate isomerase [uncultured Aliiroseovarius sp.]|uniref:2-hydroxychromene-2-carboxylate isomerase n=1 Tax=uncultured Aliiroseovarius sp. TaxID=1658783 RepID=UPI002609D0D6|nr:2-hydroxychromene-2-carboxylate isomerase [uncultured Aliiroseovarius sp.]
MGHIDYYFTVLSPWAFFGGKRFAQIADKHGVSVTFKPVDIGQLFTRTGGQLPKDRHPSRMEYRMQELKRWSKALDMPINLNPAHWPTNGAPASYAIIAAQNAGTGDVGALVDALMRSIWMDEKDIAEDAVIKDCLSEAGFDPSLADSGLLMGAETYARNSDDAVNAGAFGSPFYVCDDGEKFWGQDRLDLLDAHLAERG